MGGQVLFTGRAWLKEGLLQILENEGGELIVQDFRVQSRGSLSEWYLV